MPDQPSLDQYQLNLRTAERAHDTHYRFIFETAKAAVQTGLAFCTSAILINGGAAVAILALLGTLFGQSKYTPAHLHNVAYSLLWFAFGVAAGATALGLGYLTNLCTAQHAATQQPIWKHPFVEDAEETPLWERRKKIFAGLSIFSGVVAIILFVVGVYSVYAAIQTLR